MTETLEQGSSTTTSQSADLSVLVITLLKGVVYQEGEGQLWKSLLKLQARVREYVGVLGLELILDEAEGYAFLRSKPEDEDDVSEGKTKLPRLVARRPLSFPVSLMLALLRKKLAEFDARGGETRLMLNREEIVELIRVFLPEGSNETKLTNQVDSTINKIVELGFLRRLKTKSTPDETLEVRRILKAFVDAQWLADFDLRLAHYKTQLASAGESADE
jgi:hypothetical protein